MAFKFSKADIKDRDELVQAAQYKLDNLNTEIARFNEAVTEAWEELEEALGEYNGALTDARDFVERVKDEFETQYGEKSDKWQEGDRGTAAREWIDSFDNIELDDAEIEQPEMLEEITTDGLEALESLETEAAS